jgi:hypothetical protein
MNSMSLSNSFEKRGDDRIRTTLKNLLEFLNGLITRLRTNNLKYTYNGLIQSIWVMMNFKKSISLTSNDQTLVNLIYVQKRFDSSTS